MRVVLWSFVPSEVSGFEGIPAVGSEEEVVEEEDRIGGWRTGRVLGEGQFAVVKEVAQAPDGSDPALFAVKRIAKDKISDVKNLRRVHNAYNNHHHYRHHCHHHSSELP